MSLLSWYIGDGGTELVDVAADEDDGDNTGDDEAVTGKADW